MNEALLKNQNNPFTNTGKLTPVYDEVTNQCTKSFISFNSQKTKYYVNTIGCPKESHSNEYRVALTPETVEQLVKKGFKCFVEGSAGLKAGFTDESYISKGAIIESKEMIYKSDILLKVRPPTTAEIPLLGEHTLLISFFYPSQNKELIERLMEKSVTVLAMDCIPRITRSQSFDVLSSMANIAGYKAIVEAAYHYGSFMGGLITAAGRIPPAKVLIIGCGVAGLSALATAKSLGAIVKCFDSRPIVKEQVESLGGEFLEAKGFKQEEGHGGYGKETDKESLKLEHELFYNQIKDIDILVTTALIPGKPAPILITKDMIQLMKRGSVVVDLSAEMGGNIETTKIGDMYISENGVIHIGYTDFPSRVPNQSSKLFSNNITKFVISLCEKNSTTIIIDLNDIITRNCTILQKGELLWPPPHFNLPQNSPSLPKATTKKKTEVKSPLMSTLIASFCITLCFIFLICCNLLNNDRSFLSMITVFCLAGTAGYQAVWGVVPSLHTPLMSVTNAISGITAIGALLILGQGNYLTNLLSSLALAASCINIVGGFYITKRMLDIFKRPDDPEEYNKLYIIPFLALIFMYFVMLHYQYLGVEKMAYLASSLCCIASIAGLADQKTARFGNTMGVIGVFSSIVVTLGFIHLSTVFLSLGVLVMIFSSLIGLYVGNKAQITNLPQTVAGFHSLVGFAAMLTAIAHFTINKKGAISIHNANNSIATILAVIIGAITLTGSIVAFGKLHSLLSSKALNLPGKNFLNIGFLLLHGLLITAFLKPTILSYSDNPSISLFILILTAAVAMVWGWHLVASVGGGDMPVCITVLNSYSGWALVSEGFMLNNTMLTIVGSLIGFSGGILSYIMCVAMNRSLPNVLFGGYAVISKSKTTEHLEYTETTIQETVELITNAKSIIIVPGYGMTVARAQNVVAELARLCINHHISVKFAIHPVAGRMPGQMNVLLAEAGIPYDWVYEMDDINKEFPNTDIALVIGANDITNCAAEDDPTCAIAGMPVLQVWKAKSCIYLKRSMGSGYADLDNPVFYKSNTLMLLGNAKTTLDLVVKKIQDYWLP